MDGFDWDDGNRGKCRKHGLSREEVEHVLLGPLAVTEDPAHSDHEARRIAVGLTPSGRYAFVVFTNRMRDGRSLCRPISARFMREKELRRYEQAIADLQDRRRD